jgi:hypothetical protein
MQCVPPYFGCSAGTRAGRRNWREVTICCRTNVYPLDLHTACAVLEIGKFTPTYWLPDRPEIPITWERRIPEEGTAVTVSLSDGGLNVSISPSISVYSHHEHKRIAASICFEIAAKYAEKVGGEVIQRGAVAGCRPIGQSGDLLLARYPVEPLDWEHICGGFRAVLLGPETVEHKALHRLDGAA